MKKSEMKKLIKTQAKVIKKMAKANEGIEEKLECVAMAIEAMNARMNHQVRKCLAK